MDRSWRKAINTTEYRVEFNGELYNIEGVDHMNYKKKSIKLKCWKVRR
ncbi:MAG: phage head closure protein [Lachnospiraceae bacterium]|nr:phage head closure protein [Lachnospiraceae bacterium]